MTTTDTIVRVEAVPDLDHTAQSLTYGIADAFYFPSLPALDTLPDAHPALKAWERLIEEIQAELAPDMARMITEAVRRRLPWEYRPD